MTDRMSAAEYNAIRSKKPRVRNAVKVVDPETGGTIDSKREAKMVASLRAEMRAGHLDVLALQVVFRLEGATYRADAVAGNVVIVDGVPHLPLIRVLDAKGHRTETYNRSRRQMRERYGIEVIEK